MSQHYHVVPWYNSEEWHDVYNKIYIDLNKQEALNQLRIWKARCPSLPSGIESTLSLLEVHLQDVKQSQDVATDQFLRLAYSSAIMRFANHMLDSEITKGSSLYQAASNLGVPDWIIDLRHDSAHSNNLASIELLREATLIGLNWLQQNYWDKYKTCIEDFTTGRKNPTNGDENKITTFIQFCISLSMCEQSKIKNIYDIPDVALRESIVNDARDLLEDFDVSSSKKLSVVSLINVLNAHSKRILKGKDTAEYVIKSVLGEDGLFLSLEVVQTLSDYEFAHKNCLSTSYVHCFELLLTFLHTNDLLLDLILELVQITQVIEDTNKCRLAALWLSEILKSLNKSKIFVNKMNKTLSPQRSSRKKQELKQLYCHWFPNDKSHGLLLDLQKPVPSSLLNINFVRPIISSYNPYLTYFIADILNLIEPHLPKTVKEQICKLANVISAPENLNSYSSKVYTVDDLKSENLSVLSQPMDIDEDNIQSAVVHEENYSSYGIWKLSSKECDWSICPIGQHV